MNLDELYQELILDHHRNPRGRGVLVAADATSSLFNPLCGDEVSIAVKHRDGRLGQIAFDGHGCSISQASASMMTELCQGRSLEEAHSLVQAFTRMMKGEADPAELERLGDAVALEGVQRFAARIKCAMLAWEAMEQCLAKLKATSESLRASSPQ